jgi:hypothetical protein
VRDIETIDSELRLVATLRRAAREGDDGRQPAPVRPVHLRVPWSGDTLIGLSVIFGLAGEPHVASCLARTPGNQSAHNAGCPTPTVSSVVSLVAADGHMAPDLDVDFGARPDLFHGEFVKIAQRAAKHRVH